MFIHFRYHRGTKEIMHGKSLVQVKFQERKRLKIVAKWHSGEGLHVPSCRVRLCIRPVLALYNRIKKEKEGPIIQKGRRARSRSWRAVHKDGLHTQLRASLPDQRVLITKGWVNGMGIE